MAKIITTKLIFTLPDRSGEKYSLSRDGEYTVGRSKDCDITLDDPALEKEHAKLVADETSDTRWFLQTLSDKAITVLENASEHRIGETQIEVLIFEEENDEPTEEELERKRELAEMKRAEEARELRSTITLIVICALLAFAFGVAWRLFKLPFF